MDSYKEMSKLHITSALDGSSLLDNLLTGCFVGYKVSFLADILLKKYCGFFSIIIISNYSAHFRNKAGQYWWAYSYKTGVTISLRYPKLENTGNIVKMKGNIEGNAPIWEKQKCNIFKKCTVAHNHKCLSPQAFNLIT